MKLRRPVGTPPSKSWRTGKCLVLPLITLLSVGLSGCAPKRLKVDFTGFERAYAETSNQEMLLNLARLENRDPTYFFKIGQITSAYKMNVSLAGNAGYTLQSTNVNIGSPAGNGTPSATYENDPIFTFIPVNDEVNAQLLLKPVPAETFYFLYEQGWRVDQLVRLMVDRLELTRYNAEAHTCTVETIRNTPPTAYLNANGTPDTQYLRDPAALSSFTTFLRINAVVYWLQKHGYLLLRGTNTFVPYSLDPNSGVDDTTQANAPKAADVVNAADKKNAIWQRDPVTKKWLLGEKVFSPVFTLYPLASDGVKFGPDVKTVEAQMLADPEMTELRQGPALHQVLQALSAGFTIEGSANQQDACTASTATSGVSAHLVMRSLIGLMAAAAQEQVPFEALAQANPTIPNSPYLTPKQIQEMGTPPSFNSAVPAIERLPLLHLMGPMDEQAHPIVQLGYRGKVYRVVDEKSLLGSENQYWNRDVFRLVNQLSSQVTVDISKFPLTEILQ
jgi:hypothetical protein